MHNGRLALAQKSKCTLTKRRLRETHWFWKMKNEKNTSVTFLIATTKSVNLWANCFAEHDYAAHFHGFLWSLLTRVFSPLLRCLSGSRDFLVLFLGLFWFSIIFNCFFSAIFYSVLFSRGWLSFEEAHIFRLSNL